MALSDNRDQPGKAARQRLLLFGATGAIGVGTDAYFTHRDWIVTRVSRSDRNKTGVVAWNGRLPISVPALNALASAGPFEAVCWAQGANVNDCIQDFDGDQHLEIYEANVAFILRSLRFLLDRSLLVKRCRLCIVSSIWQEASRQNKLTYGVTKSALRGVVLSLANDLAADGALVNAVLPGVLDTPMTAANLSPIQRNIVATATGHGRLATVEDVASVIHYLCSADNTGVTAQFIKVDLGFSDVRTL